MLITNFTNQGISKACSVHGQTSQMELFRKVVNEFKPLTIFAKIFTFDALLASESTFAVVTGVFLNIFSERFRRTTFFLVHKSKNKCDGVMWLLLFSGAFNGIFGWRVWNVYGTCRFKSFNATLVSEHFKTPVSDAIILCIFKWPP